MRYEECDLETAYWVSQFLQNHSHVCHVALLSAAVALEREEPEATAWLEYERRYHAHLGFGEPGATLTCYELRLELEAVIATRMVLALRLDGDARIPRIVSRSGGRFAVVFPGAGKAEFAAVAGSAVPRGMG
jgi:hypothetical protein